MFNKKGFTLIELLTVVLIIGILAGIGVREYQRSAQRARAAEASMLIGAFRDALTAYGAEFGRCPASAEELGGAVRKEALEFYTYDFTSDAGGCTAHIYSKSTLSDPLKAHLYLGAGADGLPGELVCNGSDCDVFSSFGCIATEDGEEARSTCPNFI